MRTLLDTASVPSPAALRAGAMTNELRRPVVCSLYHVCVFRPAPPQRVLRAPKRPVKMKWLSACACFVMLIQCAIMYSNLFVVSRSPRRATTEIKYFS